MAINQVINGSDRVVENPNRYKLNAVSGQANVYDLEKQPGAITNVGTPYNKLILDKIDNVLSYLTPSVEKIGTQTEHTISQNILPTNITPEWVSNSTFSEINQSLTQYDGITPTITYKGNRDFISYQYSSTSAIACWCVTSGSQRWTDTYFLQATQATSYATNKYTSFTFNNNTQNYEVIFDMIKKSKIKLNYNIAYSTAIVSKIFVSNDNTNWVELSTISNNSDSVFESIEFYRYYKLRYESGGSNNYVRTYYMYISKVTYLEEIYQNQFTLDNNTSFSNNQRVLVETPSTLDLTDVISNAINEVPCDTMLQPSTKYELIYDETNNKFNLGGNLTLFDITINADVGEILLTGLSELLKVGKLYELIVIGYTDYATNLKFGTASTIHIDSTTTNDISSSICLFVPYTKGNSNLYIAGISRTGQSSVTYIFDSVITNNEKIIHPNTGKVIKAGTRIIIKEVA